MQVIKIVQNSVEIEMKDMHPKSNSKILDMETNKYNKHQIPLSRKIKQLEDYFNQLLSS
jgi:hypothetical protein